MWPIAFSSRVHPSDKVAFYIGIMLRQSVSNREFRIAQSMDAFTYINPKFSS